MVALTDRKGIRKRNSASVEKNRKGEVMTSDKTTISKKETEDDGGKSKDPKKKQSVNGEERDAGEISDNESCSQSVATSRKEDDNTSCGSETDDDDSTDHSGSSDDSSTGSQSLPAVSQALSAKSVVTKASLFSSSSKGKEKVLRAKHENACRYLRVSILCHSSYEPRLTNREYHDYFIEETVSF